MRQIYFAEETIKACGDQLDAYLMSLPDGQDWAWYDVGGSYYWTDVNYKEFMTAEELADL